MFVIIRPYHSYPVFAKVGDVPTKISQVIGGAFLYYDITQIVDQVIMRHCKRLEVGRVAPGRLLVTHCTRQCKWIGLQVHIKLIEVIIIAALLPVRGKKAMGAEG